MQKSLVRVALALSLAPLFAGCQPRGAAPPPSAASAPPPGPAPAPTLASAPVPPPPVFGGPVVEVPAGSRLVLRIDDTVDSGRMSAGQRFRASLDAALLDQSGKVVVPARTKVLGIILESQSAGRVAGKSEVEIAFTDLEIGGVLFPIQSQGVKAVGEGSGKDTARKVAAGALIGGAIGGSGKGAAKGAAVGGAAAMMTRGKEVKIPAGTLLELTLAAPVKVPGPEGSAGTGAPSSEAAATATPATGSAPATAAAPATGSVPATAAAAAPAAASSPASGEPDKACVKKLMANGFSADEAIASCKKENKK